QLVSASGNTWEWPSPSTSPNARSRRKLIIWSRFAVEVHRPLRTMTACVTVASVRTLSVQANTPLVWQLSGSLAVAPSSASITLPSASKTTASGYPDAPAATSDGCVRVPLEATALNPLTSSLSVPWLTSATAAVGTALHSAAAASTMATACACETVPLNGPWST